MKITPLNNVIIFRFLDTVNSKGEFEKAATESGIILKGSVDDSASSPRWAVVTDVGPDSKVKPGDQILIPNLRWTNGFQLDGVFHWKTDDTQIAAVRESAQHKIHAQNDYVIFLHIRPKASFSTQSGLVVMSASTQEPPKGRVLAVGPDIETADLLNSEMYYLSPNFSNNFKHGAIDLAFVKEEEIILFIPHGA